MNLKSKTMMQPEKAEELAGNLNRDDEDSWTYKPFHCDSGWSYVEVFDEDGIFLGVM